MSLWQIFSVIGLAFVILEMFTPSLFFFNFGVAAFIVAVISIWYTNLTCLTIIFAVLSLALLLFVRPLLLRTKRPAKKADDAYIGQVARVVANVTPSEGIVSIYDERWEARSLNGELIPEGAAVKIIRLESLVMFVERV